MTTATATKGPTHGEPPPIEFDGLVKRFGRRTVIDDLSFAVPRGSVVGLLGPNGAGKSTAMRCLLGLYKPTSGHARILGAEAGTSEFREAVRQVGAIIEAPPLYKNATALENLDIRVRAYGMSVKDADTREVLHRVGMAERADDQVGTFSLGQRQRMGIALALVGDPSIVVLDEPTNGLDPQGTVEIRDLVRSLPDRGATTLLCTHRLEEVEATCDWVVVLQRGGSLRAQGSIDEITASVSGGCLIEVAPDEIGRATRVIDGLGLGETTVDGDLITTATLPDDPAVISRALAEEGIYVRGLQARRGTLEEAFLALTAEGDS